ncbi:MAG: alcohol dehydrogenase catalytic domain-containing protein [Nitrospirae bacterium]|nr:alcohol dehydrogenase catalytic domain-containing protein [Nitrospirota bacterium]
MRALVYNNELQYLTDYPVPRPKHDEALIRTTHAGICNTDIEITKGYMGFKGVLGHEFVGVVEKCVDKSFLGKRVVAEINLGCGKCACCRNQMRNHCSDRSVLGILNKDGAFAEYVTLPVRNLHKIPNSITDEEAVFVEPLAAAYEIIGQVGISSSDRVCVLGDGKLGLLVAQVIESAGCKLSAIGRHREKLSILDEIGINTGLSPEFREREFDIVIDCTGSPSGIRTALRIVKPRGRIVLKTTIANKVQIDMNQFVINEISLIGSRCGPFQPAIKAIRSRQIDLYPLISNVYPIEEGLKAFQHASLKSALKVILKIN